MSDPARGRPWPESVLGALSLVGAVGLAVIYSLRRMSDSDLWHHLRCGEYFFETGSILRRLAFNAGPSADQPFLNHEWLFQALVYGLEPGGRRAGPDGLAGRPGAGDAGDPLPHPAALLGEPGPGGSGDGAGHPGLLAPPEPAPAASDLRVPGPGAPPPAALPARSSTLGLGAACDHAGLGQRARGVSVGPAGPGWVPVRGGSEGAGQGLVEAGPPGPGAGARGGGLAGQPLRLQDRDLATPGDAGDGRRRRRVAAPGRAALRLLLGVLPAGRGLGHLEAPARRSDLGGVERRLRGRGLDRQPRHPALRAGLRAVGRDLVPRRASRPPDVAPVAAVALSLPPAAMLALGLLVVRSPAYLRPYDGVPYPEGAVRFLRAQGLSGGIFNEHLWGGFLLWQGRPGLRPDIDGRFYARSAFDELAAVRAARPGWAQVLERDGITMAMLGYPSAERPWLADALLASPSWWLVYWDDVSQLYLENVPVNAAVIARFGSKLVNPDRQLLDQYQAAPPGVVARTREIAERNAQLAPRSYRARIMAGNASLALGDLTAAAAHYEVALAVLDPPNAWIHYQIARCRLGLGDLPAAELHLRACLAMAPDFAEGRRALAEVQQRRGSPGR